MPLYNPISVMVNPIVSSPQDMCRVNNIYVDPETQRVMVEYEEEIGSPEGLIFSNPKVGGCRVTNLFVDPESNKLVVKYDDIPQGG